jgi:hypothetical protein
MQAGEQYIKSNLKTKFVAMPPADRPVVHAAMIQ